VPLTQLLLHSTLRRIVPTQSRTLRTLLRRIPDHITRRYLPISTHSPSHHHHHPLYITFGRIAQALRDARHRIAKTFARASHDVACCVCDACDAFANGVCCCAGDVS
jgi:hypothetical protein